MEILRPLIILFLFCGLLLSITYLFHTSLKHGRRLSLLQAFMVMGVLVWFVTELLSMFKAITFVGLASSWGIVFLIALTLIYGISGGNLKQAILSEIGAVKACLMSLPKGLLAVLICTFIGIVILGLTAFVAAPNTWDSMTYHLSRVMHWEQNQSLDFYPTSIERQLHLGPFSEMAILNFQILSGNDRLANFVQFFAMIGCVIGVSWITKRLDGNAYAQVFAVTAVATLPMGILQSTSTQTDYVVALWLVCLVVLILEQMHAEDTSRVQYFFMGASLGLAILTKVTALLFSATFGLWFAFVFFKRFKLMAWKEMIILISTALIIIAPHAIRNYSLYRSHFGPMTEAGQGDYKYTNDSFTLPILVSNVLRNTAIHLAVPFDNLNIGIEKIILQAHTLLGININDPNTTWTGTEFSVGYFPNENLAGNPFHLLLIIASLISLAYHKRLQLFVFTACIAMGFLLFSWLLKWQPWHGRLHLPLFILVSPLVGLVMSNYLNERRLYMAASILFIFAIPLWLHNPTRPLIGADNILETERLKQYFANRPEYFAVYEQQAKAVSDLHCYDVGLMTGIDDWEYPIWVMTKANGRNDIHFEHILVDNVSGKLANDFSPCAILSTYPLQDQIIKYQGREFAKVRENEQFSLLVLTDIQR